MATYTVVLSIRDREVLEILDGCAEMGSNLAAQELEHRFPVDEFELVCKRLVEADLVRAKRGSRQIIYSITTAGREALRDLRDREPLS